MAVSIALPRLLRVGAGASGLLAETLQSLGLSRPLIVTDAYLRDSGRAQTLVDQLSAAGIASRVFADTVPEPTVASLAAMMDFLKQGDHDCVVGFGGGSPIDSAKAAALLAVHEGRSPNTRRRISRTNRACRSSPCRRRRAQARKRRASRSSPKKKTTRRCCAPGWPICRSPHWWITSWTLTCPPRLTADTGIDALTHAIEAYVSRRANVFSDEFALSAMRAIAPNLRRVWADPGDRAAREAMMFGSMQAGIAFSNASVALVHGMSRPIGAHFHVPHGLSNAMLLPTVTAYSAPAALGRYAACARATGVASEDEGDQIAVNRLVEALKQLNVDLKVPGPRRMGSTKGAGARCCR